VLSLRERRSGNLGVAAAQQPVQKTCDSLRSARYLCLGHAERARTRLSFPQDNSVDALWCAEEKNPLMACFISYAQNYEDVILWRTLKHVQNGFYVDCGAYEPVRHSVTKAFYDRGWRGINIEPIPLLLRQFVEQRPLDINLAVAVSDHSHGASFYEVPDTGLSTLFPDIAAHHVEAGFIARKTKVPTSRLSDILRQFAPSEIHFLKVDVEGAEELVLRGADFENFRPWIVIVEAIRPTTRVSSNAWEASLLASKYDFVYFDGLNRFYLAQEHAELTASFALPPNVFDDFVLDEIAQTRRIVEDMTQSTSWRLTAPLRRAKMAVKRLREHQFQFADRIDRLSTALNAVFRRAFHPALPAPALNPCETPPMPSSRSSAP
jgi:FkbM family methyltransferase